MLNENNLCGYHVDSGSIDRAITYLNWEHEFFDYPNMVALDTITDGSCFFHAIVQGFYKPYIQGYYEELEHPIDKKRFVRNFRKDLAFMLDSTKSYIDDDLQSWYEYLSRGKLKENSKDLSKYSLQNMRRELDSNKPVDNMYLEFVSELLNLDIYILDGNSERPYITGNDNDILYKGRKSIVILYENFHYSTVGIENDNNIKTIFSPFHPFIQYINEKTDEMRKSGTLL